MAPPPWREHDRDLVLHAEEHAGQVVGDDPVPLVVRVLVDRQLPLDDAGVVVRVVQPAVLGDHLRDHVENGGGHGHVRLDEQRRTAVLRDQLDGLQPTGNVDVGHRHPRAARGEPPRRRAPHPVAAAGHQGDLA